MTKIGCDHGADFFMSAGRIGVFGFLNDLRQLDVEFKQLDDAKSSAGQVLCCSPRFPPWNLHFLAGMSEAGT